VVVVVMSTKGVTTMVRVTAILTYHQDQNQEGSSPLPFVSLITPIPPHLKSTHDT
jgi:hypothetical protein